MVTCQHASPRARVFHLKMRAFTMIGTWFFHRYLPVRLCFMLGFINIALMLLASISSHHLVLTGDNKPLKTAY